MGLATKVWQSFAIVLGLTGFLVSHARGDSLSIEQAILQGKENSPKVQRAQAALDEAQGKRTEALSGFLPSVNASAQHFFSYKYQFTDINFGGSRVSIPGIFPTTQAVLSAQLPIFDGLANVNPYSAARSSASPAESLASWSVFSIEREIRVAFLKALAAQKLAEVSKLNLKTIEDHLEQTQALKKGGTATNFDVLRVEVQVNEARTEVLRSEDESYLARRQLSTTMGLKDDTRTLEGDLPVPGSTDLSVIQSQTSDNAPNRGDLRAQIQQVDAMSDAASASSKFWIPKISLGANYTFYNNLNDSTTDLDRYRSAYQFGVFLNWNLFDGLASSSRARQAQAQKAQAEKALDQALLEAPQSIELWKRRAIYTASLYTARKSDVEKAEESVRLAKIAYRAGTRTATEVLDAELELFRARAGVVTAQRDHAEALTQLELSLGRKI